MGHEKNYVHCENCNNDICYDCLSVIDEKQRNQCWHCHTLYCPYQEHLTDKQMEKLQSCGRNNIISEYNSEKNALIAKAQMKYQNLQKLYKEMTDDIFVFKNDVLTSRLIDEYRNMYRRVDELAELAACSTPQDMKRFQNKTIECFHISDDTRFPFMYDLFQHQNRLMNEHGYYIGICRLMVGMTDETLKLVKERYAAIIQTKTYDIAKRVLAYNLKTPLCAKGFNANEIISHFDINAKLNNKPIMCCRTSGCRGAIRESDACCDRCHKEYCRICMQPKHEGECKEEDLSEWKILQEETKACPRCGYRFGHHAYCHDMWCINCFCCFQYDTGYVYPGRIDNKERDEYFKLKLDLYDVMPELDIDSRLDLIHAKVKSYNIQQIIESINDMTRYKELDVKSLMNERCRIDDIAKILSISKYAMESAIELTRVFSIDNSYSRAEKYDALNRVFIRFLRIMKVCKLDTSALLSKFRKLDSRMLRPLWESLDYEMYMEMHRPIIRSVIASPRSDRPI